MGVTPEQLAMIAGPGDDAAGGPDGGAGPPARAGGERARAGRARRDGSCGASATCSFRTLVADADSTLVIVARFLALLELFREAAIAFDQEEALGELTVRWTGQDEGELDVGDEFDEADGTDHPRTPTDLRTPLTGSGRTSPSRTSPSRRSSRRRSTKESGHEPDPGARGGRRPRRPRHGQWPLPSAMTPHVRASDARRASGRTPYRRAPCRRPTRRTST